MKGGWLTTWYLFLGKQTYVCLCHITLSYQLRCRGGVCHHTLQVQSLKCHQFPLPTPPPKKLKKKGVRKGNLSRFTKQMTFLRFILDANRCFSVYFRKCRVLEGSGQLSLSHFFFFFFTRCNFTLPYLRYYNSRFCEWNVSIAVLLVRKRFRKRVKDNLSLLELSWALVQSSVQKKMTSMMPCHRWNFCRHVFLNKKRSRLKKIRQLFSLFFSFKGFPTMLSLNFKWTTRTSKINSKVLRVDLLSSSKPTNSGISTTRHTRTKLKGRLKTSF